MAKHSKKLTKTKPKQSLSKQSKGPGLNKEKAHIKKAKTKKKLKKSRKGFPDTRISFSSSSNSFKFKKKKQVAAEKIEDLDDNKIEDLDDKKDKSTKKTIAAPASSQTSVPGTSVTKKKHQEKHDKSSKAKKSNKVQENSRINEKKDIKLSAKHKIQKRKISEGSDKNVGAKSKKTTAAVDVETVGVETSAKVPHLSAEVSANWKNFLKILPKSSKNKRPIKKDAQQESKQKAPEVWFDDVDKILLERPGETEEVTDTNNPLVKDHSFEGVTKVVAMDCEMVGVGDEGEDSVLARVSIVNQHGHSIYDKHVKPTEAVTDYRTRFSGIRKHDLDNAEDFKPVQAEVYKIIQGRILVGHAIHNDLKVLFLDHPKKKIRDTSRYKPFRALLKGGTPSLKKLSDRVLGVKVQEGEHNSIQDAQAAMRLYTMYRQQWEKDLKMGKKVSTAYNVDYEKSQKFQKRKRNFKNKKSKVKSQ